MTDGLTSKTWASTFDWYRRNADGPTQAMAAALYEIVNTIDDPKLGEILDALALRAFNEGLK